MDYVKDLDVKSVDFQSLENSVEHRTNDYELLQGDTSMAILRRGQPFTFKVQLRHNEDHLNKHNIVAVFTLGSKPNIRNGTKGIAKIDFDKKYFEKRPDDWEAVAKNIQKDSFLIEVRSPSIAAVGLWSFQLETKTTAGKNEVFSAPKSIYLLFNPWIEADQVYMSDTELLKEYVLSDVGKVYRGNYKDAVGYPWIYGQFDDSVLPVCMIILKHVPEGRCGDPVKVVRVISKLVNANDADGGLLYGNWGETNDGTPATAWTGSVAIFEEYLRTRQGVKWAQCWVFAAVVTTVCRALGIPCRTNTNISSAHDTNGSCTIDYYYDRNNKPHSDNSLPGKMDSVWNFHVWNDVWMARPNLPKGYGGWQAIDATPQEKSDGYFQCGPAPVEAIKNGVTGLKYDVTFLFAEVNADVIRLKEDPESEWGFTKMEHDKYQVGVSLLTKKPGKYDPYGESDREDIMSQYKYTEDTLEERVSIYRSVARNRWAKRILSLPSNTEHEISFYLKDIDKVSLGDSFQAEVEVVNKSKEDHNIQIWLTVESVYYNGIKGNSIKSSDEKYEVKANTSKIVSLAIQPEDYLDKLVEQCMFKIRATAYVCDVKLTWAGEDDLQIIKPSIDIQVPSEIKKDVQTKITLEFKNPLNKALTYSKFIVQSPGLIKPISIKNRDAEPLAKIRGEFNILPRKTGSFPLVATFHSKELRDIMGSVIITCL